MIRTLGVTSHVSARACTSRSTIAVSSVLSSPQDPGYSLLDRPARGLARKAFGLAGKGYSPGEHLFIMMSISIMQRHRMQVLGKCDSVAELEIPKDLLRRYRKCELCPRRCRVDRTRGEVGICREGVTLRVASVEAHMGEEPPVSGVNGSGAVFFTGCSLRCIYCQNHQISHEGLGREWSVGELVEKLVALHESTGIHN